MGKISPAEIYKILDRSSDINEAIKKAKELLWANGYTNHGNKDRFFFKYDPMFLPAHSIDIDLRKYTNDYTAVDITKINTSTKKTITPPATKTLPKAKIGLFDRFKMYGITDRANDEILYEYVLTELEEDIKFKGLWAKAYANSEGNDNKIEPLYMQYRVQAIKDSLIAMEIAYNEMAKQDLFQYIKSKGT